MSQAPFAVDFVVTVTVEQDQVCVIATGERIDKPMPQDFKCPSNGGSPDDDGSADLTIRCPFCGNMVVVPEELRRGASPVSSPCADSATRTLGDLVDTPGALDRHPPEVSPIAYKTTRTTKRTITDIRLSRFSSWGWIVGLAVIAVAVILLWSAFSAHKGDNRFAAFIRRLSPPTSTLTPTATPFPAATHAPTPIPVPTPTPRFFEPRILVGCTGPQRGCFESAQSIGVDGAGNIYVGDLSEFKGGRVEVFDPTGEFIAEWTIGDKDTDLDRIAVDRQGTVYVVSDGNIYRYEGATAKPRGQIEYSGGQGFQDVAVTADSKLVASWNRDWQGGLFVNFESQDDIVVFDSDGKVVNVFRKALSEIAGGDAELDTVITVDRQGNLYANGSLNPGIYKFTPDGKFVGKFGESQVDEALSLAVDAQGRMYASCHSDILIFAPDGRYIELEDWSPEDMVFNDQNELIILRDSEVIKFVLNR